MSAPLTAAPDELPRRDRTARHARQQRRARVSLYARFALALGAVIGLGAGITSAAWEDTVTLTAHSEAAGFQMEFSYHGGDGVWCPFPKNGAMTFGTEETPEDTSEENPVETPEPTPQPTAAPESKCPTDNPNWYHWIDPNSPSQKHSYFIRNAETGSRTTIIVDPFKDGFFVPDSVLRIEIGKNNDPSSMKAWKADDGAVTVELAGGETALIEAYFDPAAVGPKPTVQSGDFRMTITGRVGPGPTPPPTEPATPPGGGDPPESGG